MENAAKLHSPFPLISLHTLSGVYNSKCLKEENIWPEVFQDNFN